MGAWLSTNNRQNSSYTVTPEEMKLMSAELFIEQKRVVDELQKQNQSLMSINKQLRKELKEYRKLKKQMTKSPRATPSASGSGIDTKISAEAIKEYVDQLIENEAVNIKYLPDFVERQIYHNVFNMLLNILDHVLNNSHIALFNHEIKFDITAATGGQSEEDEDGVESKTI
jgi:hypothetical protein